ncbi:hypothetical protein GPECTOR_6g535 [Gonium pectorale]|uniref:Uncharacterized protein n=1 Tax=Gonium pectorale TaxID=33097 RepID=A0A150GVA1_GONPE|nr:hypothetical protein GPECTOR_6g535 [Gonium pectorale]|eukprot:KXZ53618.1 hypothetical protein GPECTOR_6g535 [Gonium pectorale]
MASPRGQRSLGAAVPCGGAARRRYPDAAKTARLIVLSRVLGLPAAGALAILNRTPELLGLSPEALEATLGAVADLTGIRPTRLASLLVVDASLLLKPDVLKARQQDLSDAGKVLRLGERDVAFALSQRPALLAMTGERQQQALQELADAWGLLRRI